MLSLLYPGKYHDQAVLGSVTILHEFPQICQPLSDTPRRYNSIQLLARIVSNGIWHSRRIVIENDRAFQGGYCDFIPRTDVMPHISVGSTKMSLGENLCYYSWPTVGINFRSGALKRVIKLH